MTKTRAWKGKEKTIFGEWPGGSVIGAKNVHYADEYDRIEQTTPYYDKNKNEIYEGDLITNKETVNLGIKCGEVFLNDYEWAYDCGDDLYLPLKEIATESIIIGNITENPELLI